jgi:hypothetical protein
MESNGFEAICSKFVSNLSLQYLADPLPTVQSLAVNRGLILAQPFFVYLERGKFLAFLRKHFLQLCQERSWNAVREPARKEEDLRAQDLRCQGLKKWFTPAPP